MNLGWAFEHNFGPGREGGGLKEIIKSSISLREGSWIFGLIDAEYEFWKTQVHTDWISLLKEAPTTSKPYK